MLLSSCASVIVGVCFPLKKTGMSVDSLSSYDQCSGTNISEIKCDEG